MQTWMARHEITVADLKKTFARDPDALVVIDQLVEPAPHPGADPKLAAEFTARGPWVTRFWIGGVPYGGPHDLTRDPRLAMAEAAIGGFAAKRVLELGSLEGGHSIALAQRGATVVGLEGREANCERARWVAALLGVEGIRFEVADVRTADLGAHGRFDLVLASGLLYHLDAPWELLARLVPLAPWMYAWTHYVRPGDAGEHATVGGEVIRGAFRQEYGLGDPLSGLQPTSFWPTREGLETMLRLTGWRVVTGETQPEHPDGPAITLVARRAGA